MSNFEEIINKAEEELQEDLSIIDDVELKIKEDKVEPIIRVCIDDSNEGKLRKIRENIQENLNKYTAKTGSVSGKRASIEESKIVASKQIIENINEELSN